MPDEKQIAVINAHPRIGGDSVAVRWESEISYVEQGHDREAGLDRDEIDRLYGELAALNQTYEQRFSFRFVVFIAGRPKSTLVSVMKDRLSSSRDQEIATGLRHMVMIARDKFKMLSPPGTH